MQGPNGGTNGYTNGRISVLNSDWFKIMTLLGSLIITLFMIGSWWGETQTELRAIGATVQRLDANIADFARHAREEDAKMVDLEYRLKSMEHTLDDGPRTSGGDRHPFSH